MTNLYEQQPCDHFAPLISAMIDGELESDASVQLDEHLKTCEACRQRAASFREIDSLVFQSADRFLAEPIADPNASIAPAKSGAMNGPRSLSKALMRWVPLATAATILIALMVTTLPSNRSTVTAEQIARPLAELEIINADHRESQERTRKMLELDLRALKLELAQLDETNSDTVSSQKKRLEEHVNQLIVRVNQFGR